MKSHEQTNWYTYFDSPVGTLLLESSAGSLTVLRFESEAGKAAQPTSGSQRSVAPFDGVLNQLAAYFDGELRSFELPLAPRGTPFQRQVWQELCRIPFGETVCYADIAQRIGRPRATRAVGAANGKNPIAIIIPCHRVIGKNGSLTGFGGGLATKRALLELEKENER